MDIRQNPSISVYLCGQIISEGRAGKLSHILLNLKTNYRQGQTGTKLSVTVFVKDKLQARRDSLICVIKGIYELYLVIYKRQTTGEDKQVA